MSEGSDDVAQRLKSMLELLKALELKESDFQTSCKQIHADMQAEIRELENEIMMSNEQAEPVDYNHALSNAMKKLDSAKKDLAAKFRENLSLKRQVDDVPVQMELIQFERRFSELYAQIQEKHQLTQKHYATYNALLEIKELMLKEASLLNSINSQFQDALASTTACSRLIDSMEVIVKGIKQKLGKVELELLTEQKVRDSLKEKYAKAISERRHFASLLKAFQEECTKSEKLRCKSKYNCS
ncbi:hypothetical protein QJS04_geneDACA005552 [Acorus gramineus]|uniref:CCDC93 coiled-coil domain-containing protein n=1 Tax=Acorus gramineus TaxID=55184 RepID=A0AAV9A7R9_ACOGR|nr:hypothetical protein QJS04_geneDACA005552 [Acorus gramineus]